MLAKLILEPVDENKIKLYNIMVKNWEVLFIMYDENSFKNYIFWLQVKRVFLMIVFSVVGAFIGIVLSQFLIDVLLVLDSSFKVIIIAVSTLLFFCISLLLTAGTGKEVQEGYWKMAVLRKLTVISKKLDYLENIDLEEPTHKEAVKKVAKEVKKAIKKEPEIEQLTIEDNIETTELPEDISDTEKKNNEKPTTENASSKKPNTLKISKLAKK